MDGAGAPGAATPPPDSDHWAVLDAPRPGPNGGAHDRGAVDNDAFYGNVVLPGEPSRDWPTYLAEREGRFAGVVFLAGFLAVFVNQAPIHLQIVFGAPIFEEALKFGAALGIAVALRLRWLLLRLPLAAGIGAAFGWFEHLVTYSGEDGASYAWRVAFHALTAALSMVAWRALATSPPPHRWAALLPSILIHYANNVVALLSLPVVLAVDGADLGVNAWGLGLMVMGAFWLLAALTWPAAMRAFARRSATLAARLIQK